MFLRVLSCLSVLFVVACDMPGQVTARHISKDRVAVVANGNTVTIGVPDGYCVAEDSVSTSEQGAFILISDCLDAPQGEADNGNELLTASVSFAPLFAPGLDPDVEIGKLEEYLRSEAGLPLLGRGGANDTLSVLESRSEEQALFLLVEDRGEQVIPNAEPRFWRAFMEVNERMVSLSVSTFQDNPTNDRAMLERMEQFVVAIRRVNQKLELPRIPLIPPPETIEPDVGTVEADTPVEPAPEEVTDAVDEDGMAAPEPRPATPESSDVEPVETGRTEPETEPASEAPVEAPLPRVRPASDSPGADVEEPVPGEAEPAVTPVDTETDPVVRPQPRPVRENVSASVSPVEEEKAPSEPDVTSTQSESQTEPEEVENPLEKLFRPLASILR